MSKHTKEPWCVGDTTHENGEFIETAIMALEGRAAIAVCLDFGFNNLGMREANACRIVACVNACAEIDTEVLEKHAGQQGLMIYLMSDLVKQRDELLAALKDASEEYKKLPHSLGYPLTHCNKWDELIAKVESEK